MRGFEAGRGIAIRSTLRFEEEFEPLYGFSAYEIPYGGQPFYRYEKRGIRFVFYRFEQIDKNLRNVITSIRGNDNFIRRDNNIFNANKYINLYSLFKKQFVPTKEMFDFYYDNIFFHHFYKDQ